MNAVAPPIDFFSAEVPADPFAAYRQALGTAPVYDLVEEVLRMENPSAGLWRVVGRGCDLGGVPLKAGTMLMRRFAAARTAAS